MKVILQLTINIIFILLIAACNIRKDSKVIYVDKNAPIDSNMAVVISYDKQGNITNSYYNKKYIDLEGIVPAINSLNDSTIYEYTDENGIKKKSLVYKITYRKELLSVEIKNDTIKAGSEFVGYIKSTDPKAKYFVTNEKEYTKKVFKKGAYQENAFIKTVEKPGIYIFKGYVIYDDEKIPFNYNYLVVL